MTNRKYTNDRTPMSDTDIEKFKDFDGVLNSVNQPTPENPSGNEGAKFNFKQYLKYAKNIFIAAAGITAAVVGFNWLTDGDTEVTKVPDTTAIDSIRIDGPAITPPLPGAQTPFTTYTIDAQKDEVITTSTGTIIRVKKNTFIDEQGKVIKGKIDIQFREYHNVIDLFKSGIPMEYDSAGRSYTFESAGMFELEALKGGDQVHHFDKDIEVEIVSENAATDFNDYYYDTLSRKWEYMAKSTISETKEIVAPTDEDQTEIAVARTELRAEAKLQNVIAPVAAVQKPTAPSVPIYPPLLSSRYAFEVDYDKGKFSEIPSSAVFQVDETQSSFSPVYYKVKWDKLELSRGEKKGTYSLYLEKGNQKLDVVCFPAISKEAYARLKMEYEAATKAYQDSLAIWNTYLATQVRNQFSGDLTQNDHYISQTETELITRLTYRKVPVSRAGVFNCDKPIYTQKYFGDEVNAKYTDGKTSVKGLRTYVAEGGKNALFGARNGNVLLLDKRKNLVAWVWTVDHKLAILDSEQLREYTRNQKFDVVVYPPEEGIEKVKELLEG